MLTNNGRKEKGQGKPWRDRETLERLYLEERLSGHDIADRFGCHNETIYRWLDKFGIERRDRSTANRGVNRVEYAGLKITRDGYVVWQSWNSDGTVEQFPVHRLLAIHQFGPDTVAGNEVHHKNGIPWDNRAENLEVLSNEDHRHVHSVRQSRWYGGQYDDNAEPRTDGGVTTEPNEGTERSPSSYVARRFGAPSLFTLDFEEWMAASWCSEETILRVSGV